MAVLVLWYNEKGMEKNSFFAWTVFSESTARCMFLGTKRRVQTGGREDGELSSHSAAPHQRLTRNFTSQCPLVEHRIYSLSQNHACGP